MVAAAMGVGLEAVERAVEMVVVEMGVGKGVEATAAAEMEAGVKVAGTGGADSVVAMVEVEREEVRAEVVMVEVMAAEEREAVMAAVKVGVVTVAE